MSVTFRSSCHILLAAGLLVGFVGLTRAEDSDTKKATKPDPVTVNGPVSPTAEKKAEKPAADAAPADAAPGDEEAKEAAPAAKPPRKKLKVLSPEMTARRDRVRRLLTALRKQPFNTQQNDCADIIEFCRGFGCDTELADNAGSGQKVNGITCLCWNMPCAGFEVMTFSEGHLAPRVGFGYQSQASEMAAVLALSQVPPNYPARVGRVVRTVADLIEYEKLTCRAGTDMSLKLVALSRYVREPSWKDNMGGEWTLKRVVAEELNRPTGGIPFAATNRLLGLVTALDRFKADKTAIDGDLARAESYVDESKRYAFSSQNSDGSWGRATNRDYATAVSHTSHMLEWLVASGPASELEDPRIAGGIDFLTTAFNAPHYQNYISTMSAREVSAAMHAAYVLNYYDQAVFAPANPPPTPPSPAPAKTEQKSAERDAQTR